MRYFVILYSYQTKKLKGAGQLHIESELYPDIQECRHELNDKLKKQAIPEPVDDIDPSDIIFHQIIPLSQVDYEESKLSQF